MRAKNLIDAKSTKELAVGMFYYTSGSILGPLLLFGVLGYILDGVFNTKPMQLIVGVVVAFIVTNILLFKKIKQLNRTIDKHGKKKEENSEEVINE